MQGKIDAADVLVNWPKCDKDEPDENGDSPLHIACIRGHVQLFVFLVDAGCNKDFANADGETVLHVACRKGYLDIIRNLVDTGAKKNKPVPQTLETPLMLAAAHGHLRAVQYLVASGVHVNGRRHTGETALFVAASLGHLAIVQHLVQMGAGLEIGNQRGETPLATAAGTGHLDVVCCFLFCF